MPSPERRRREAAPVLVRPVAKPKAQVREYAEALAVALLLALVIRTFVVQAFKIPSASMLPTLQVGDHLLVNKFVYGPRLGDVIVFLAPARASADRQRRDFIKRVIAVEGQTIEVRAKQVYVDGKPWDDPHATFLSGKPGPTAERPPNPLLRPCGSLASQTSGDSCAPYTVPPGHVFVMGDNREQSYDSRFWGPVPISDIKGQALIIYWSWDGPDRWVRWDRIGRLVY